MKKNLSILVVGATGGSVSEGIIKALRLAGYTNLSILEHSNNAAHLYSIDKKIIIKENPDTGNYIDKVIMCCIENAIECVIPGSTWEAFEFSKYVDVFNKNNISVLVNNINVIKVCNNKWETYTFLKKFKFGTPQSAIGHSSNLPEFDYPIILKPIIGRGSRDVFLVNTPDEFKCIAEFLHLKYGEFLIQEYLSSNEEEYTVGIISNKEAEVIDSIVMQRYLNGGYTNHAKVCKHSFINEFCENVAYKLKSTGPLNIQLRLNDKKEPCIFEINPRFSGSAPMRAIAGFNEPDMIIKNFVYNQKINKSKIKYSYEFFRVFQEFYIDQNSPEPHANLKDYLL